MAVAIVPGVVGTPREESPPSPPAHQPTAPITVHVRPAPRPERAVQPIRLSWHPTIVIRPVERILVIRVRHHHHEHDIELPEVLGGG